MKKAKKLASVILALMLVLGMSATAFAESEGAGSITVKDAVAGQEYTIYQILDLESYNKDAGAYVYKANSVWESWLETQTAYVAIDAQGNVTWVTGADTAAFAAAAQKYAKENSIADQGKKTAESETVSFSGLSLGYYLVDTTLGTLCSLNTTNPDAVMYEKNDKPSITKEVEEDSTGVFGPTNDADINQVVNFKSVVTVQKGAENYIMHDEMSAGLTYAAVDAVKTGNTAVAAENYTVKTEGTCGCTFEIAFDNAYIETLAAGTEITVLYSAVLNEDAVVGLPGNPNKVRLQYGDASHPSYTPYCETITYTWDAKVIKYTVKDGEEITLAGAAFKLSSDEEGNSTYKFHALGENKYEICADAGCEAAHVTEITTEESGEFIIEGLDAGTYYLTETVAPNGYNQLAGPVVIEISGASVNDEGALVYTTVETKVENKTGPVLPATGGIGTTILYVVGAVLVIGAGVLLVTRRRAGSH